MSDNQTLTLEFEELDQRIIEIHARWMVLRNLFGSQQNVDALNATGGFAIRVIQNSLWDAVVLGICRVLDPAVQGKFKNLTLEAIQRSLPANVPSTLADELGSRLAEVRRLARDLKADRNTRIGHSCQERAMGNGSSPVPSYSIKTIDSVLEEITKFMNAVKLEYAGCEMYYKEPGVNGDGQSLATAIAIGVAAWDLDRKRWQKNMTREQVGDEILKIIAQPFGSASND